MTDAEKRLWQILRSQQIDGNKFRRQVPIGSYIADFVCHEARLVVEIDGGQHDPSMPSEIARAAFLQRQGYRLIRFWNNDVLANLDGVHHAIIAALSEAPSPSMGEGWGGGEPAAQRSDPTAALRGHPHPNPPPSRGRASAAIANSTQQALWFELMQFYIREAWLLDERRFKEWLDLFTDDVLYFMPRRKNVHRREADRELTSIGDLAILEEDKRYLEMRVARLDTGMAWAEDPPSRTRHLIGNLEATPLENGEAEARTAFLVYRSHLETDAQLLSGCREDRLRQIDGAWKVARRTIVLDANVLLDKNLSVFL